MTSEGSQIWFVFNELSARCPAPNDSQGRRRMDDMLSAVVAMKNDRSAALLTVGDTNLWEVELACGYTVTNWLSATDRDRRAFLLRIASTNDIPPEVDEALCDRFHLSEFFLSQGSDSESRDRVEAKGLGAAFLFEGIGLSLLTEDRWGQLEILLRHTWLDKDCQEKADDVRALNLSGSSQVEDLSELLLERSRQGLRDAPVTLAARKHECFPHLRFGLDVDSQLEALPRNILPVATGKLMTLDAASQDWRRDPASPLPNLPMCHDESKPTMVRFGDQRLFRDSEGNPTSYTRHAMMGSAYRIHLRFTHNPRGIEVGYIGRHLDTVKYH